MATARSSWPRGWRSSTRARSGAPGCSTGYGGGRVGPEDVAIPGLERMDDDQAYRALDLLIEAGERRLHVAYAPIEVV